MSDTTEKPKEEYINIRVRSTGGGLLKCFLNSPSFSLVTNPYSAFTCYILQRKFTSKLRSPLNLRNLWPLTAQERVLFQIMSVSCLTVSAIIFISYWKFLSSIYFIFSFCNLISFAPFYHSSIWKITIWLMLKLNRSAEASKLLICSTWFFFKLLYTNNNNNNNNVVT